MNIYWDIDNNEFVAGLTKPQKVSEIAWRLRDLVYVTLYTVRPVASTGAYYELVAPPAGWTPAFCAKSVRDGSDLVALKVWTLEALGKYSGIINLDTPALIAALAGIDELDVTGEFVLQDEDGFNRDSSQFVLTIEKDVMRAA